MHKQKNLLTNIAIERRRKLLSALNNSKLLEKALEKVKTRIDVQKNVKDVEKAKDREKENS